MKLKLPNDVKNLQGNNLVSEYLHYIELYTSKTRTSEGNITWTAEYSGRPYSTELYPNDGDIYNRGEEGLMNLLHKKVLSKYIIDEDWIRDIDEKVSTSQLTCDVVVEYDSATSTLKVVSGLPTIFPTTPFDVRFYAPVAVTQGDKIALYEVQSDESKKYKPSMPIYTLAKSNVPSGTWVAGSIVQLTISPFSGNSYAMLGGFSTESAYSLNNGAPSGSSFTPQQKQMLWIDDKTGIAYFWSNSRNRWHPIAGVFS